MHGNEIPEGAASARRAAAEMFLLNEITQFLLELNLTKITNAMENTSKPTLCCSGRSCSKIP